MAKTVNIYRVSVGGGSLITDNFLVQAEDLLDAAKKGEKLNQLDDHEITKIEYVGEMRSWVKYPAKKKVS
jgi:hypothetical protein